MRTPINLVITSLVAVMSLMAAEAAEKCRDAYAEPLKPTSFTSRAVVLPPRSIGKTVIRSKSTLAVEFLIEIEDYLPRGLEATLLVDGQSAAGETSVRSVDAKVTVLSFVVADPQILRDGAVLTLQLGDLVTTRARVPGEFERSKVRPLSAQEARAAGVPSLAEWFSSKASRSR